MKGIYKFNRYFGKMGELKGVFVADSDEVENIIGVDVYFGEVLGKFSEIQGTIRKEHVILVTEDPIAVEIFEKYNLSSGYNPIEYHEEEIQRLKEESEEELEEEETL